MLAIALTAVTLGAPAGSPYKLDLTTHATLTAATYTVLAILEGAVKPTLAGGITCDDILPSGRCDPAPLSAIDRLAVGNHSTAWSRLSDVGAGISIGGAVLGDAALALTSGSSTAWRDYFTDVVVMAESVAAATAVTHVLKYAVRRPRPTQYREGAFVGSSEHSMSFPSGHTAATAAAAFSFASTFAYRKPESPWRFVVFGGAAVLTAFTGYGRIGGGWHFPTDVFAGAVIGLTSGVLLPRFYHRQLQLSVLQQDSTHAAAAQPLGLQVSGQW